MENEERKRKLKQNEDFVEPKRHAGNPGLSREEVARFLLPPPPPPPLPLLPPPPPPPPAPPTNRSIRAEAETSRMWHIDEHVRDMSMPDRCNTPLPQAHCSSYAPPLHPILPPGMQPIPRVGMPQGLSPEPPLLLRPVSPPGPPPPLRDKTYLTINPQFQRPPAAVPEYTQRPEMPPSHGPSSTPVHTMCVERQVAVERIVETLKFSYQGPQVVEQHEPARHSASHEGGRYGGQEEEMHYAGYAEAYYEERESRYVASEQGAPYGSQEDVEGRNTGSEEGDEEEGEPLEEQPTDFPPPPRDLRDVDEEYPGMQHPMPPYGPTHGIDFSQPSTSLSHSMFQMNAEDFPVTGIRQNVQWHTPHSRDEPECTSQDSGPSREIAYPPETVRPVGWSNKRAASCDPNANYVHIDLTGDSPTPPPSPPEPSLTPPLPPPLNLIPHPLTPEPTPETSDGYSKVIQAYERHSLN